RKDDREQQRKEQVPIPARSSRQHRHVCAYQNQNARFQMLRFDRPQDAQPDQIGGDKQEAGERPGVRIDRVHAFCPATLVTAQVSLERTRRSSNEFANCMVTTKIAVTAAAPIGPKTGTTIVIATSAS